MVFFSLRRHACFKTSKFFKTENASSEEESVHILILPEMGACSCGPLRSRMPVFLDFSLVFPRSCTTFFFAFRCAPAFLFCVPMPPSVCVGVGEQLITRALCVYGWIRRGRINSPPRHNPLSSLVRGVRVAVSRFGVKLVFRSQSPLPPLLSVPVTTVSSLHRNANLGFLLFRIPRSRVPV